MIPNFATAFSSERSSSFFPKTVQLISETFAGHQGDEKHTIFITTSFSGQLQNAVDNLVIQVQSRQSFRITPVDFDGLSKYIRLRYRLRYAQKPRTLTVRTISFSVFS